MLLKQFGLPAGQIDLLGRAELIKKYLHAQRILGASGASGGTTGRSSTEAGADGSQEHDEDMFRPDEPCPPSREKEAGQSSGYGNGKSKVFGGGGGSGGGKEAMDAFEKVAQQWAHHWASQVEVRLPLPTLY